MSRAESLASDLAERDLDALLVTDLVNVRYLTGFTGSNAAALVLRDGSTYLATDGRYAVQAAGESPDVDVVGVRRLIRRAFVAPISDHKRVEISKAALLYPL